MNEGQNVFSRHEMKYLISSRQRAELEELVGANMRPDKHGESRVTSLYLDTPQRTVATRCLMKPQYKQKLRIRAYGMVSPESTVFLELKEKYGDLSYKRRIELCESAAMAFALEGAPLEEDGQIARELSWARLELPGLRPVSCVSSFRRAYFSARAEEDIRLTFDKDVLWRDTELSLCAAPGGEALLPEDMSIMEVKTASAIPLWLCRGLSRQKLYRTSFSKYGGAHSAYCNKNRNGDAFCA